MEKNYENYADLQRDMASRGFTSTPISFDQYEEVVNGGFDHDTAVDIALDVACGYDFDKRVILEMEDLIVGSIAQEIIDDGKHGDVNLDSLLGGLDGVDLISVARRLEGHGGSNEANTVDCAMDVIIRGLEGPLFNDPE